MSRILVLVFTITCAGALLACSGLPLKTTAIPSSASPDQEISRLARRVDTARDKEVAVLSPSWFSHAEASLQKARVLHATRDKQRRGVLDQVALGLGQLDRAEELARISRATLPRAIEARDAARKATREATHEAGAPSLKKSYSKAERQLLELTSAIEDDDASWVRSRQDSVTNAYLDVELRAIKKILLSDIRAALTQARRDEAAKLVPSLLAQTESKLHEVESFIAKNRYARPRALEMSKDARFQAQRLSVAVAEARRLKTASVEALYLKEEERLHQLSMTFALPDMRNSAATVQRSAVAIAAMQLTNDRNYLVDRADGLRAELAEARNQIARLKGQTTAEQQEISRLESERHFNELCDEVSAYFEADEAEVYKQGQRLVIRLRKIRFPVGDHVLQPASYELLSKVQRAIRAFGTPRIVIEGHTDATGSAELNTHLSALRANAVRDYLVANKTIGAEQIAAVGMGFSEPLASNRTIEGRAQNRRIDVSIDASPMRVWPVLPSVSAAPPIRE